MARNPSCLVMSTLGFEGGAIGSNPKRSSPQRFKMSRQRVSLHFMPICTRSHGRPPAPPPTIIVRDFMPHPQAGGVISTYFHQLRQVDVEHIGLQLPVIYGRGRLYGSAPFVQEWIERVVR